MRNKQTERHRERQSARQLEEIDLVIREDNSVADRRQVAQLVFSFIACMGCFIFFNLCRPSPRNSRQPKAIKLLSCRVLYLRLDFYLVVRTWRIYMAGWNSNVLQRFLFHMHFSTIDFFFIFAFFFKFQKLFYIPFFMMVLCMMMTYDGFV